MGDMRMMRAMHHPYSRVLKFSGSPVILIILIIPIAQDKKKGPAVPGRPRPVIDK